MYNEHFGFTESPFKGAPDPRFFFVNPCYEEAFATLRYGIEARKGFIVVTGDAGTGKTTLLKKVIYSSEPNVRTACIYDPHPSFTELLQRALKDFGLPSSSTNRLAMMRQIYDYLVRQLEHGQIVCLIVDEAQNLSDETLEELRLLSNLETHTDKLLQIVLAGQPEFEERLDRPELFYLKQRVVLRCRLRALQRHEVGLYIDSRLKTVNYPHQNLFDAASIEQIAFYSNGVPRLINIICDDALQRAYESFDGRITAAMIEEIAHGLKLSEGSHRMRASVSELRTAVGEEAFPPTPKKNSKISMDMNPPRPASDYFISNLEASALYFELPKGRHRWRKGVGAVLTLSAMAAAGTVLHSQLIEQEDRLSQSIDPTPEPKPQKTTDMEPEAPLRALEHFLQLAEDPKNDIAPVPDTTVAKEKNPRSNNPSQPLNDNIGARKLEIEIYKAIHDRAISGVQVSVSEGTVYLDGRVATPRQKLAATRATLSVPGVKRVQNGIIVTG